MGFLEAWRGYWDGAPSEEATPLPRRLAGLHPLVPPIVAIIVIIVLGIIAHFASVRFANKPPQRLSASLTTQWPARSCPMNRQEALISCWIINFTSFSREGRAISAGGSVA